MRINCFYCDFVSRTLFSQANAFTLPVKSMAKLIQWQRVTVAAALLTTTAVAAAKTTTTTTKHPHRESDQSMVV